MVAEEPSPFSGFCLGGSDIGDIQEGLQCGQPNATRGRGCQAADNGSLRSYAAAVAARQLDPYTVAEQILQQLLNPSRDRQGAVAQSDPPP